MYFLSCSILNLFCCVSSRLPGLVSCNDVFVCLVLECVISYYSACLTCLNVCHMSPTKIYVFALLNPPYIFIM